KSQRRKTTQKRRGGLKTTRPRNSSAADHQTQSDVAQLTREHDEALEREKATAEGYASSAPRPASWSRYFRRCWLTQCAFAKPSSAPCSSLPTEHIVRSGRWEYHQDWLSITAIGALGGRTRVLVKWPSPSEPCTSPMLGQDALVIRGASQ